MADAPREPPVISPSPIAPAPRRIFVRAPVPVVVSADGVERTILVSRVTARHAGSWETLWAQYKPELLDWTPAQFERFVRELCKAGLPEPDPALGCPERCQCRENAGMHDLIDRLGREEIDLLFGAVLEANAPKGQAATESPVATSPSTRRSRGSSWLASLWRRRSTSRSRRSDTSSSSKPASGSRGSLHSPQTPTPTSGQ